jgi:orotate phosphoribosyltransferase
MIWETVKEQFIEFIINNKVIGFPEQPIKLKSGRSSCFYVNWRTIAEDVYLLDKLTDYLIAFIRYLKLEPNCFYGVPEGASKLAIITQFKWARSHDNYKIGAFTLAMGRGKPKNHGDPKDKFFLGYPKGDVIILEDTSTTGQSLIKSVNLLKNFNINILTVISLTNREEISDDGKYFEDNLKEMGIKYCAMSNVPEILSHMELDSKIARQIEAYYKDYGIRKIKLTTNK